MSPIGGAWQGGLSKNALLTWSAVYRESGQLYYHPIVYFNINATRLLPGRCQENRWAWRGGLCDRNNLNIYPQSIIMQMLSYARIMPTKKIGKSNH